MTNLKQVKNKLKEQNLWSDYKNKFKHKSMRLIVSDIVITYEPLVSLNVLVDLELKVLKAQKDSKLFIESFRDIKNITNKNFNWNSLGKFMWFAFQTSTYYSDVKSGISNVYTKDNFIEINTLKTKFFYEWMHSISLDEPSYNTNIRSIMKRVF